MAGPNGSGKSTYVARVLQPVTGLAFVNADVIAAREWPGSEEEHAYEAAEVAAAHRREMLAARSSFITETVFSHPSKVDLAREARGMGYLVHLHVMVIPADLCVARVGARVSAGGHTVPEHKIREHYLRLWAHVVDARAVVDRTVFHDNSRADQPFRVVAEFDRGRVVGAPQWPAWTPPELLV